MASDGAPEFGIPDLTEADSAAALARFHVRVQQTRLLVYAMGGVLAWLAMLAGSLKASYADGLTMLVVAALSTLVFLELYRRGLDRRVPVSLDPVWMGLDVLFISWAVRITGGIESPWYLWYLANGSAAAFVAGARGAIGVGLANVVCYIAVLAWIGDVRGFDANLIQAGLRMVTLYSAAFFFLRGVVVLQEKQRLIRKLQQDQQGQVDQLVALTQDLDQGTRALAEANVQIREADRMKSQFLANMSHELRTPLNSIIGFSEILIERLQGQVSERHLKFLTNIHGSGQHLLGIINDILDLSKIEAGKMEVHPEEVKTASVVEGVLAVMHGMASKRGISFDVDAPADLPTVETDPVKLKQILYNLCSNAVKFSQDRAVVKVKLRILAASDSTLGCDTLSASVIDSGIGIAPENQELIFAEFRQIDASSTRQYGGTGLGLAIVKKFAELQGGLVTLESEVGKGSTFTVLLPLRVSRQPLETSAALPPPEPAGGDEEIRVLVVEDDLVAYQSISRFLAQAGYAPIRARHGEEALELAKSHRPAVITLDLALPGLSGWDVLKELKRDPATKEIPVVIISMSDNRDLGVTLGADDYFVKPVDRQRLILRLHEIAPPSTPQRAARVLLIDDDPGIHDILDAELTQRGYLLDHALGGAQGIEMAASGRPDAIILDLMMPDVTGFEVAAALQEREETARIPVVVLTAKDLSVEERRLLHGKIAALVEKGHGASARLVAAIRGLATRYAREGARAR